VKKEKPRQALVVHTCNPSILRKQRWGITAQDQLRKKHETLLKNIQKAKGLGSWLECLHSKCEALSSFLSTTKKVILLNDSYKQRHFNSAEY
jgi:hypothetical protein